MNDEHSLSLALLLIDMFLKCSGLTMNMDNRHKTIDIEWTSDPVKYLAVWVYNDLNKSLKANIDNKLDNIENITKIWNC